MGVVGEPTGRWTMPGAPASYPLHQANYRPAPEEQGALGKVLTRRHLAGRGSWRTHSKVAAGWLRHSPLLLADSVWVLGCSEGPVLPHPSRTRVHAVLFAHERQKIHVEGSLLGGVTYNLGDMRGGSHSRSWWEDSLWRSRSLDGDVRGGSHSRSWHRRGMAVSQASCQLLSASTSVQSSSCLTRLRV